jgi:hypothetical protein
VQEAAKGNERRDRRLQQVGRRADAIGDFGGEYRNQDGKDRKGQEGSAGCAIATAGTGTSGGPGGSGRSVEVM